LPDLKGIILDVDGTLVDSNEAHVQAWVKALKRGGYDVPAERIRPLIGMGSDNLLPTLISIEKDTPEGEKLSEYWKEIFESEYLPSLKAFPKTKELLKRLKADGFKLAVASSAEKEMLKRLLEIAGADKLIEDETSADDAENSKPDPDIVQAALDKLALKSEQVVMLGDTPYDIEAATKIGVNVIALRCGGWNDDGLKGAIAIYDDPADLLAHLDDSPLAVKAQDKDK
jgi:HAD superfamily hydrolase (TIGR01549 family)